MNHHLNYRRPVGDEAKERAAAHLSDSPSPNVSRKLASTTASLTLCFSLQIFESISCFLSREHIFTNEDYNTLTFISREHIGDLGNPESRHKATVSKYQGSKAGFQVS
jgi:hypothetical protein